MCRTGTKLVFDRDVSRKIVNGSARCNAKLVETDLGFERAERIVSGSVSAADKKVTRPGASSDG
jgi:hypothetical protein